MSLHSGDGQLDHKGTGWPDSNIGVTCRLGHLSSPKGLLSSSKLNVLYSQNGGFTIPKTAQTEATRSLDLDS